MSCHYDTKHGAQAATLREMAQASWCVPGAIRQLLPMLLKNMDTLLQQELVIIYFIRLNVMRVISFDSRVFLAEVTKKITKYF